MLDVFLNGSYATAFDWLVVGVLVVIGVVVALMLHSALFRLAQRLWGQHHPVVDSLLKGARGVTRYALILVALSIAVPLAPLPVVVTDDVHKILLAAFVVLVGWVVLLAANLTMDHYISRYHIDTTDNLLARKAVTQFRILKRLMDGMILLITLAFALMTFDSVRQFGISLFASAGVAGLVVGMASRSVLANIFAGIQLALTQPIRVDDVVVVEGEFGWVEEITSTYIVIRIWDLRRMVVPLSYFIEKPFQNWTRTSSQILGTVMLYVDYTAPVERIRQKAVEIANASVNWDKRVVNLQVTDVKENTLELRVLVSAIAAGKAWDLRVEMREKLIAFLQREVPSALPRRRNVDQVEIAQMAPANGEDKGPLAALS
jgi:small-conductance mechanosensitive channel